MTGSCRLGKRYIMKGILSTFRGLGSEISSEFPDPGSQHQTSSERN